MISLPRIESGTSRIRNAWLRSRYLFTRRSRTIRIV